MFSSFKSIPLLRGFGCVASLIQWVDPLQANNVYSEAPLKKKPQKRNICLEMSKAMQNLFKNAIGGSVILILVKAAYFYVLDSIEKPRKLERLLAEKERLENEMQSEIQNLTLQLKKGLDAAENAEIVNHLNFETLKPYLPIILLSAAFIGGAFLFKSLGLLGGLGNCANFLGKSVDLPDRTLIVSGRDSSFNDVIVNVVENNDGSTIQILFGAGQEVLNLGLLVKNFAAVKELGEQFNSQRGDLAQCKASIVEVTSANKVLRDVHGSFEQNIRETVDVINRKEAEIGRLQTQISELKAQISNSALTVVIDLDLISAAELLEELTFT